MDRPIDKWLPLPFELFVTLLPLSYCYFFPLVGRHPVLASAGMVPYVLGALFFTIADAVSDRRLADLFRKAFVLVLTLLPLIVTLWLHSRGAAPWDHRVRHTERRSSNGSRETNAAR